MCKGIFATSFQEDLLRVKSILKECLGIPGNMREMWDNSHFYIKRLCSSLPPFTERSFNSNNVLRWVKLCVCCLLLCLLQLIAVLCSSGWIIVRFLHIFTMIYPVFIAIKNWAEQLITPSHQAAISHVKILNILGNFLPYNNRQNYNRAKKQVLKLWVYDCFNLSTHVKPRRFFYHNFIVVKTTWGYYRRWLGIY